MNFPAKLPKATVCHGENSISLLLHLPRPMGFQDIDEDIACQITAYNLSKLFELRHVYLVGPSGEYIYPNTQFIDSNVGDFELPWQRYAGQKLILMGEPIVVTSSGNKTKDYEKSEATKRAVNNLRKSLDHAIRKAEGTFDSWYKKVVQRSKVQNQNQPTLIIMQEDDKKRLLNKPSLQHKSTVTSVSSNQHTNTEKGKSINSRKEIRQVSDLSSITNAPSSFVSQRVSGQIKGVASKPVELENTVATKQCPRCMEYVPTLNMELHSLRCSLRKAPCPYCNTFVDKETIPQHIKQEHEEETCECGARVRKKIIKEHRANSCIYRNVKCEFCEVEIQQTDLLKHQDFCGSRTELCQNCGSRVQIREMAIHLSLCMNNTSTSTSLLIPFSNTGISPVENKKLPHQTTTSNNEIPSFMENRKVPQRSVASYSDSNTGSGRLSQQRTTTSSNNALHSSTSETGRHPQRTTPTPSINDALHSSTSLTGRHPQRTTPSSNNALHSSTSEIGNHSQRTVPSTNDALHSSALETRRHLQSSSSSFNNALHPSTLETRRQPQRTTTSNNDALHSSTSETGKHPQRTTNSINNGFNFTPSETRRQPQRTTTSNNEAIHSSTSETGRHPQRRTPSNDGLSSYKLETGRLSQRSSTFTSKNTNPRQTEHHGTERRIQSSSNEISINAPAKINTSSSRTSRMDVPRTGEHQGRVSRFQQSLSSDNSGNQVETDEELARRIAKEEEMAVTMNDLLLAQEIQYQHSSHNDHRYITPHETANDTILACELAEDTDLLLDDEAYARKLDMELNNRRY